ncbi:hypothetical protein [Bifidobacterium pseudocatenulatum]|uniref:hypothetical protein n=1 Tax=Bifidobacterium pseudocatenulatum TaxID=28026 RepID=UPI001CFDCCB8|nr:hypothetical protein [Bifidobacterium pseudocatenulatum]MCB4894629.1 hypothetical protein [Bifidobacterium pseudocatenulatum]
MVRRGYVQLANGFYLNRKVRRLRRTMPSAIGAYAIMLSYCGDNLTDGYVDADTAKFVLDISEQELDALQQAGLVESVEGGYVVHDYLEHNRSRQQVMAKRKRERERYSAESLPAESAQTAGRIETESGQTPEHQNTRTQKKEKEEYSSSFSKETTADEYLETGRLEADRQISRQYPNLDLTDAWGAFMQHHHGETRTINEWTRLWKGWCQRRANMSGIPPSKRHIHTWQCEHVLQALGRDKETATPDQRACQMAKQLNKEKS